MVEFFLIMPSAIFIERQKIAIGFSGISFIRIYFLNGLLGMTAEDGAIGKIVGVIYRSRSQGGGQDKAVVDISAGMFFKTVMRLVIFHRPSLIADLPGEFKRFTVFINFTFGSISFFSKLF